MTPKRASVKLYPRRASGELGNLRLFRAVSKLIVLSNRI